jgi:RNA polymerase primary sigma factor
MVLRAEGNRTGSGPAPASVHDVPDGRGLSASGPREPSTPIEGGVLEDRNRLIQDNLHLVVTIAREFRGRGLELDDLRGEGTLGLIRAAERFDPRFGTRFSSYATYWVREAIRSAVMNTAATIRLPAHLFRLMSKWRQAERRFRQRRDRSPTFDEVAAILGLSAAQKSLIVRALQAGRLKLESCYMVESGSRLSDEVVDRYGPIDERLEADEERAAAFRLMGSLDDHELAILKLHYGLEGESLSLREIGQRLGVSGEWVRTIERRALGKLGRGLDDPAVGSRLRSWKPDSRSGASRNRGLDRPS